MANLVLSTVFCRSGDTLVIVAAVARVGTEPVAPTISLPALDSLMTSPHRWDCIVPDDATSVNEIGLDAVVGKAESLCPFRVLVDASRALQQYPSS